jgi:hypothetical protein
MLNLVPLLWKGVHAHTHKHTSIPTKTLKNEGKGDKKCSLTSRLADHLASQEGVSVWRPVLPDVSSLLPPVVALVLSTQTANTN